MFEAWDEGNRQSNIKKKSRTFLFFISTSVHSGTCEAEKKSPDCCDLTMVLSKAVVVIKFLDYSMLTVPTICSNQSLAPSVDFWTILATSNPKPPSEYHA